MGRIVLLVCALVGTSCSVANIDCSSKDLTCHAFLSLLRSAATAGTTPTTNYRYFVYFNVPGAAEGYEINSTTGALTAIPGSPFSGYFVGAAHPSGKFMYGVNGLSAPNNVFSYTINQSTGALSPTSTPTVNANATAAQTFVHPGGGFVFIGNAGSQDVSSFTVDQTTGNLTKVGDYPTACGCGNTAGMNIAPNGKFFYTATNLGANNIVKMVIDQNTGVMGTNANLGSFAAQDAIAIDPTSTYLYVTITSGQLRGFSINPPDGVLTQLPGSPYGGNPGNFRIAMHPSGKYLYTVNISSAPISIAKHDIASDGSLSAETITQFGTNLQFVTVDPSGRFAFVNNGGTAQFYALSLDPTNGVATVLNGGNPYVTSGNPGPAVVARVVVP